MENRWESVYRKKDEIVSREIAGETILVPIKGRLADMQRIFSVNPVGGHIWQRLDGESRLGDIRDSVALRFDVEQEKAESDIVEFIDELIKADLIRRVS
jgi:hypothetical protein